ncbi:LCP family glycopolymer transferase [Flavonifractor sp. HCP28S3_F3]|uniref:LCP family protein n=1 Tax=Flavonifractor sp. HCP28S3_F3 TaxID=3438939 RepID=UPI003F8CA443
MPGKRARKASSFPRILKRLYLMAVVLSAIIVIAYLAWKAVIKPPPMAEASPAETQVQAGEDAVHTPAPSSTQGNFERRRLCYTFLLVASDQASANADTIMVLTYDTVEQTAGLVSIPRDTLVDRRFPKINAVYHDGIEALRDEVSRMLGIPIDYYICVDVDGFVQVVDAVDGIDFDVPIHMSYDDPLQDLHIHFEPGMQHINGKEALAICRLRKNSDGTMAYPDSDIGRTRTQQQVLVAIAKKLLKNPQKIFEYIEIWKENVVTDLKAEHMAWFVSSLLDFPLETGLSFATLPGDGTVKYKGVEWCYELYPEETLEIVNEMLNPYTKSLTEQNLDIFQAK